MNCKPGDLAVVVGGIDVNLGKVVRVTRLYTGDSPQFPHDGLIWEIEGVLIAYSAWGTFPTPHASDEILRPIRDQPGNESWFTAAPRSKPATTKQDTINERGELA